MELKIYIVLSCLLFGIHRAIDGIKQAGLYGYQLKTIANFKKSFLVRWLEGDGSKNTGLHFLENCLWYSKHAAIFLSIMAVLRQSDTVLSSIAWSSALTLAASGTGRWHRQKYINITAPTETKKSEWFFGLWTKRLVGNAQLIVLICSILTLFLYVLFH